MPPPKRDRDHTLAWVNSICLLFLIIGIVGARTARISIHARPSVEEVAPVLVEPLQPPPTPQPEAKQEQTDPDKSEAPRVVVVTLNSPAVNFSVPTIGNLVVPNSVATAPPIQPMQEVAPLRSAPAVLNTTGSGGERPQPPYPRLALEQGHQGSVLLQMTVNEAGSIEDIQVKQSSGSTILDHSALEFVRRHWTIPSGKGTRAYEATIIYKLMQ